MTYLESLCDNYYIETLGMYFGGEILKIDKGFIGGSTLLLILSLLEKHDRYGYEIIRELELRSDKTFEFKEGSLYPVLHKLEKKGFISSYTKICENGRERKYYQITQEGIKQLAHEKEQWEVFSRSVNKVIGGEAHALS